MASAEQEDGSSSPRDDLAVSSVAKRGAGRGRVTVRLSDGSSFSLLEEVQREAGIFRDQEISRKLMESLQKTSEDRCARRKALALLSRAPQTREGLRLKLRQRGFPEDSIDLALARMDELGYLNDRKYAEDWIQIRLQRHPEGRWRLLAGLRRQGVPRRTAQEVISRVFDEETELRAARRAMDKLMRTKSLPDPKAAARLSSLGFTRSAVRQTLNQPPD